MLVYSLFFWKRNLEDCLWSLQSYCTLGSCHTFVHPAQHVEIHIRHWLSRIVLRKDGWWLASVVTFGWTLDMCTLAWLACIFQKASILFWGPLKFPHAASCSPSLGPSHPFRGCPPNIQVHHCICKSFTRKGLSSGIKWSKYGRCESCSLFLL